MKSEGEGDSEHLFANANSLLRTGGLNLQSFLQVVQICTWNLMNSLAEDLLTERSGLGQPRLD